MALEKVVYEDNVTVIEASQLNAIQDELIRVAGLLGKDIQSAAINDSGHLILTLTDGTTLDAGVAKGSDASVTAANVAAAMGLSGLAADDQIMVSAVDADGKPTGWRKKYRDMLNVRDFGAKGDGVPTTRRPSRRRWMQPAHGVSPPCCSPPGPTRSAQPRRTTISLPP